MKGLLGPACFYSEALKIAVPVVMQQLVMSMASLVDNFMVGGLGDVRMSAVNVANQVNFVYFVMLWTLCAAGGIYISQFRGADKPEGMKQAYRFKVILAVGLSVVHTSLSLFAPEAITGLMVNANAQREAIVAEAASYMRITAIAWLPIGISTAIGTAFREIGKPKAPLLISSSAAIVNTALNWVLIYGNLGAPALGVTGAAIATVAARLGELGCYLAHAAKAKPDFYVPLALAFKADPALFKEIIAKSGMMLLSETTWVLTETVTTALYNGRGGAEVVSGMSAGWAMANVFFLVFPGIHTSVGVIVGSALGADRLEEAREKARWLLSGSFVAGFAVSALALAAMPLIPIFYESLSADALGIARGFLMGVVLYMPLWTLLNGQFALARSGGDTGMGAVIDIGVNMGLFIPGAFALALLTPMGPVAMFLLLKSSDALKAWIAARWLKKERWLRNLVAESA
jgi:putative MATE family efflux protein